MKSLINKLTLALIASMIVIGSASGQEDKEKAQREADAAKRAEMAAERASQRSEEAIRNAENRAKHYQRQMQVRKHDGMRHNSEMYFITDSAGAYRIMILPDSVDVMGFRIPEISDIPDMPDIPEMMDMPEIPDFYRYHFRGNVFSDTKPGSSWNYSRKLAEATFVSDYSICADENASEVNLSISGGCAEGSISIAIVAPDRSKLTEVVIDENGSMNWRKSFNLNEGKWNNGSWVFKVNAKSATGNFEISLEAF